MLASSWLDLVLGVDIHIHLVPSPAGPVPTPIPQPHMGLIGDPVGMMVGIAQSMAMDLVTGGPYELPKGPVLINGFPAGTTGEQSKNTPLLPHLPMPPGTAHVKPPTGEAHFKLGALNLRRFRYDPEGNLLESTDRASTTAAPTVTGTS
jgi:hypothetical protein